MNDDQNGLRDCYVKVYILPEENLVNQTRIVRRSLNPKFFEVFNFHVKNE